MNDSQASSSSGASQRPLDYASADSREATGWFYFLFIWNVAGCVAGGVLTWMYRDSVGDAYGPMLGIILGLPTTVGAFLVFLVPTLVLWKSIGRVGSRGQWTLGIAAFAAPGIPATMTFLCIVMPHTNGSGC